MGNVRLIGFAVLAAMCACAYAQDVVTGKYSGYFTVQTIGGDRNVGLSITLASVEGDVAKGTGTMYSGACAGDYPFEGTVKDGEVRFVSKTKGGRAGDCGFGFRGKLEGNKLVGKFGKYDVELRK